MPCWYVGVHNWRRLDRFSDGADVVAHLSARVDY